MKNKNKLVGTKLFIENDLSHEDRKKQEQIYKWVKAKREKENEVKVGIGSMVYSINGVWKRWEKIGNSEDIRKNRIVGARESGADNNNADFL